MVPNLFLYYELSNLNSELLLFHSVRPNLYTYPFMTKGFWNISTLKKKKIAWSCTVQQLKIVLGLRNAFYMKDYQPQIFKIFMAFDASQIQAFRSNNNDKDLYRVSQIIMHPWPFQTIIVHFHQGGEKIGSNGEIYLPKC